MELSRRDAVAALAVAGVGVGGLAAVRRYEPFESGPSVDDDPIHHLEALAEVLYPADVDASRDFLETYVGGRIADDETYETEVLEGLALLDREAEERLGDEFADLSIPERDELLRDLGLHETPTDPDGDPIQRVRYYLVDELLYALFTTPTGGELVGTENPTGFAGGLDSYRRGEPE